MKVNWIKSSVITLLATMLAGTVAFAAPANSDIGKLDVLKLSEWDMTTSSHGGKLLLSDSPETVPGDGIMYQDIVSGAGRLFFHHVNGTKEPKKIVVLLENSSSEPARVTVSNRGLSGPGYDYLQVGKAVQVEYLTMPDIYLVEVPAKGSSHLIYELNDKVVEPDMLVNGMYDFHADRPVNVKVMMLPVKEDVRKFAATAKVLPADQWRLRGTFEGYDRMMIPHAIYNPSKHGTVAITLADNAIDMYAKGIDATDGTSVVNYGNYGVVYRLFLASENSGNINYWINPRGGEYAGALGIKYNYVARQLNTPADRLFFGTGTIKEMQKLGAFEAGRSLWFTFSPPGASNLPVKIIVSPEK